MERIDLHVHTLASDGSDAPATVVRKAAALGLRAVAITDHDTFAGLPEALSAGTARGIEVVPGVELSTVWGGEEVHLLGYYMDTDNAALRALMTRATDERNARNETMVQRLHDAGYPITMAELRAAFPGQTVLGRPHIAALLVQRGCIPTVSDGMRGLLGRGKRFYVPRYNIPLEDSVRALRAAGGVPVVAHLFKYRFDDAQRTALLAAAADAGALGLEVRYTTYTPEQTAAAQALALRSRADRRVGLSRPAQAGHRPRLRSGGSVRAVCLSRGRQGSCRARMCVIHEQNPVVFRFFSGGGFFENTSAPLRGHTAVHLRQLRAQERRGRARDHRHAAIARVSRLV